MTAAITRTVLAIALLVLATVGHGTARGDSAQIKLVLKTDKEKYELGEWIQCGLEIKNVSKVAVVVPDVTYAVGKPHVPEGVLIALSAGRLELQVSGDGKPIEIVTRWNGTAGVDNPRPTAQLQPGECLTTSFYLSWPYNPKLCSIEHPGDYRVQLDFHVDGQAAQKPLTASTRFAVVAVPGFREKNPAETDEDYSRHKVGFFLTRITERKGRYFANVWEVIRTSQGMPALIQHLDAGSPERAAVARTILTQIRYAGDHSSPEQQKDENSAAWREWWAKHGAKLSTREMWERFDSNYQ